MGLWRSHLVKIEGAAGYSAAPAQPSAERHTNAAEIDAHLLVALDIHERVVKKRAYSLLRTIPLWSGATLIAPPVSLALGGLTLTTTFTLSAQQGRQSWRRSSAQSETGASVAGVGLGSLSTDTGAYLHSARAAS